MKRPHRTWLSWLGHSAWLCLLPALLNCSSSPECPPGAERCPCYRSQFCDEGLECLSGVCVEPLAKVTSTGGTASSAAGAPGTGGTDSETTTESGSSATGGTAAGSELATVKFCSLVKIDGEDVTLRLSVVGMHLDAETSGCATCSQLPAGVPLDFEVVRVPEGIVVGDFQLALEPGLTALLATVESGEIAMRIGSGSDPSRCEEIDVFEEFEEQPIEGPAIVKFCNEASLAGDAVMLRLAVEGLTFDAVTDMCSSCQELPSGTELDFRVLQMPEATLAGEFRASLRPGTTVLLAEANGDITSFELGSTSCADADPL